ncbi:SsrA-binding protein [Stella humosa]|uniref:SsrA-binding protein n=1 Tax=Stella humosa TaxID=94 RepID=A0A3N1KSX1_9PROT|nr:SsrA-binding protein SmpB [Stella humosa]ROP83681.1 SsrA-binding protein [Stella humosa]BBK33046.1 ssrA-binding protein [Stella humosa]
MAAEKEPQRQVAQNRRARFDYHIDETLEAGLVLFGSEVKSLRKGAASIGEAHAGERDGELYLFNAYIPEYPGANRFNHEPRRARKLLVHRKEMSKLLGQVKREGVTLVPMAFYFNDRGIAKVQIGLARGKKMADKRNAIKEREWNRDKARLMRAKTL